MINPLNRYFVHVFLPQQSWFGYGPQGLVNLLAAKHEVKIRPRTPAPRVMLVTRAAPLERDHAIFCEGQSFQGLVLARAFALTDAFVADRAFHVWLSTF